MAIPHRINSRTSTAGKPQGAPGAFRRAFPYVWRSLVSVLLLMVAAFGAGAAGTPPARAVSAPSGDGAGADEEQVGQLLDLEQQAVAAEDIAGLMTLWAPDSSVTDARFTPNVPEDDIRWRGRPAVQRRYQREVIPGGPGSPRTAMIQVDGSARRRSCLPQANGHASGGASSSEMGAGGSSV